MISFNIWASVRATAPILLCSALAHAQATPCSHTIDRQNLVQCALRSSLSSAAQLQAVEASRAQEAAVSPLLPSNPVVSASLARRTIPGGVRTINWYASLSQELEIAGQRGARRRAAQAEVSAETSRLHLTQRDVAVEAWSRYFEALAAREELSLAVRLATAARELSTAVSAKAASGLLSPLDADVTDALEVRALQASLVAEHQYLTTTDGLASLLGRSPDGSSLRLEGELTPLDTEPLIGSAMAQRPELLAAESERQAMELRADAYRRSRVPNPTLSVFVENDGLDERVLGAGISLPIPLPGNVGRTFIGEIAEAEARAKRASAERELIRRAVRLEVVAALRAHASKKRALAVFTPEKVARATRALDDLREQVEAGRMPVRDAIVARQTLVELLQGELSARLELCLASLEVARALGFPLESRSP